MIARFDYALDCEGGCQRPRGGLLGHVLRPGNVSRAKSSVFTNYQFVFTEVSTSRSDEGRTGVARVMAVAAEQCGPLRQCFHQHSSLSVSFGLLTSRKVLIWALAGGKVPDLRLTNLRHQLLAERVAQIVTLSVESWRGSEGCHSITSVQRGGLRQSPPIGRPTLHFVCSLVDVRGHSGRENGSTSWRRGPQKVRWCWLLGNAGWLTPLHPPLVSQHSCAFAVGDSRRRSNPARCGTPCPCALWNTTSAADVPCGCSRSREDFTGRTGLGVWGVCSIIQRRARR
ncbi:hypothetical protein GWK47_016055 [Chionoecetes opilio]|uniref:Uncharacterized protein n=1 Tax=Chionoecetes opilio TaxID=41210 RepID=A0A8J4XWT4_CHIOP|nr:hypothetical protein GWK47_016055 [Chionoecetes opilio]